MRKWSVCVNKIKGCVTQVNASKRTTNHRGDEEQINEGRRWYVCERNRYLINEKQNRLLNKYKTKEYDGSAFQTETLAGERRSVLQDRKTRREEVRMKKWSHHQQRCGLNTFSSGTETIQLSGKKYIYIYLHQLLRGHILDKAKHFHRMPRSVSLFLCF